uniref:UPF0319 protein n=1 Tax=Syphacia muris TaxID=451379 RepID=A0A0N5AMX8_9BILA
MSDYQDVPKGGLRLKKGEKVFKKKKKQTIDLRKIDLTIQREGDSAITSKTPAEIAFEKRQEQNQVAAVSHREKVERFNAAMSELTEFNDIPKVSWTK